ncbi:hypothetical protein CQA53_00950 [Helicobacter didelphidarum]|uniref:Outer membrane beta-barrel protein n=1 Tax=Helicobacter didelphidarum TaxID=2040648 RepID=A0A3D8IRP3_9HELI|nr:outer membrane beta-barrel protein [Helicobacter didelphidarum]RDU67606.1 hypothetical protein CQA53_00950 [Helicobacter didelphidarum]
MKNFLVSLALVSALSGSMYAKEQSGVVLGVSVGGGGAINVTGGSNATGSSVYFLGAKVGYQAFITDNSGVRFYLSGLVGHGFYPSATTPTSNSFIGHDLYTLIDIDADYLYNWTDEQSYSAGLFLGFFAGALIGTPLTGSTGSTAVGSAIGINFGLRTTIAYNHQVEFGVKPSIAFFAGREVGLGSFISGQVSYIYKFDTY